MGAPLLRHSKGNKIKGIFRVLERFNYKWYKYFLVKLS